MGVHIFSVVYNEGYESLWTNPLIGPNGSSLYRCGGLFVDGGQGLCGRGCLVYFFRCFGVFTSFHMFHFMSLPKENQTIEKQTCLTQDFVSLFIHIFDSGPGSMRLFPSQQVSIGVWSPHCFSALGRCSWCQVMIRPHHTINW